MSEKADARNILQYVTQQYCFHKLIADLNFKVAHATILLLV